METRKTYAVPNIVNRMKKNVPLVVSVPGSKSITNRALLIATLTDGVSNLSGVLFSDDSRHFLKCIQDLGFETTVNEDSRTISVKGLGGVIPKKEETLYVGSAGTAARFLTALLGISEGTYHMTSSEQMQKRPMGPLLSSLKELGCEIEPETTHFPFTLTGHGFCKQHISIQIDSSSQFMSALMISACLSKEDFTILMEGSHGLAYVQMTEKMMKQFGVEPEALYYCNGNADNHDCTGCINSTRPYGYKIPGGKPYTARDYAIEPDVSAASYFYAMAPLLGIPVIVTGVHFDSLQGDVEFIRILERMGCKATETEQGILLVPGTEPFHGITVDMSSCSDQAITLAAIAPFATAPTTITGIGHIRLQECDRLNAIVTELTGMGIQCESTDSSITIYPGMPKPYEVNTYDDHRMAMGFSLIGLRSEGIVIKDPGCCKKTFEDYFQVLDHVISNLTGNEIQ